MESSGRQTRQPLLLPQLLRESGLDAEQTCIGALKQVPGELLEAANLDGANKWQTFKNIILPHLKPVSFMVIILSVISSFKVFAMVQTLTNGGPGTATTYMIQYIYTTGFTKNKVILLILSFVQTKVSDKSND